MAVSVLLDVFLPVLPSGVLVITAATAAAAGSSAGAAVGQAVPNILALTLSAATASVLGDLVAYRLAWRGGERLDRAIARSRRLSSAQERLGAVLARGGGARGALVVLARFAPAGRSVVSLGAGAAHRRVRGVSCRGRSWRAWPGPPTASPSATSAASGWARADEFAGPGCRSWRCSARGRARRT